MSVPESDDRERLPHLSEVLPRGRGNGEAVIQQLEEAVRRYPDEFDDDGAAALRALEWLRQVMNAEYDAAEWEAG